MVQQMIRSVEQILSWMICLQQWNILIFEKNEARIKKF